MTKLKRYIRKGFTVLKDQGALAVAMKTLEKVDRDKKRKSVNPGDKITYRSLVARADVMRADWSTHPYAVPAGSHKSPYTINWVMSPPSGGGGHQNIFRFIEYLDKLGHKNNVYLYSTYDDMTLAQARDNVRAYCRAKHLSFMRYKGSLVKADAVFATGWETAYPVFNDATTAHKLYFVQDFEPYFYPMGTDYVLAENTYKFGFHGITAGGFLDKKLNQDYGMKCDHYDFGAEAGLYKFTNRLARKEIFFYARPVTERRAFDLGIMALEVFHKKMPNCTINLAGWDVSGYDIPFPYINHKALHLDQLSTLYNNCSAALVLSLTNMSLLPLELLSCGTIPVVNDGPNNRLVSNNPYIAYTQANPQSLAEALTDVIDRQDLPQYAALAAASVGLQSWEVSCKKFIQILNRELSHG